MSDPKEMTPSRLAEYRQQCSDDEVRTDAWYATRELLAHIDALQARADAAEAKVRELEEKIEDWRLDAAFEDRS